MGHTCKTPEKIFSEKQHGTNNLNRHHFFAQSKIQFLTATTTKSCMATAFVASEWVTSGNSENKLR
jgi:hypothetical protein